MWTDEHNRGRMEPFQAMDFPLNKELFSFSLKASMFAKHDTTSQELLSGSNTVCSLLIENPNVMLTWPAVPLSVTSQIWQSKHWVEVPAFLVEAWAAPALQLVSGGVRPRESQEEACTGEVTFLYGYLFKKHNIFFEFHARFCSAFGGEYVFH